ncbi:MAG TPA: oligosaccharide flippase family protein [Candidatus Eisenbacteria bacterium]|nr:oligosaccharide flippase family protein [Candidatus Eisenbacteria bacterium]
MSLAPDQELERPGTGSDPARDAQALAFRVAHNAGLLAVSNVLVRGLGMGMMIVLARYLGPAHYGTYQRAEAFVYLFSIVVNLGLDMILTREVAKHRARASEYFSGILVCKAITGLIAYAIILSVAQARGYSGDLMWAIRIFGFILLLNSLSETCGAVIQGVQEMRFIALAHLAAQVVFLSVGLASVLTHRSLHWILGALALGAMTQLVFSSLVLRRSFHVRWSFPGFATVRFLLRESLPLALAASFVLVYQQIDAVMLGEYKGDAEVGLYKAGAKFLLIFSVIRDALMVSIYPVFASLAKSEPGRLSALLSKVVRYQLGIGFYFILCFVLLSRLAPVLLGPEFHHSAAMLPILGWILLPQTISIACGRALIASGRQNRLLISTSTSLGVNIGLNLMWIPRFGILGAAAASVVSEVVVAYLNMRLVRKEIGHTHFTRELWRPALAAALAGATMFPLRSLKLVIAFPLLGIFYLVALFLLRAVTRDEVVQLRTLLVAWLAAARRRSKLPAKWMARGAWIEDGEP